MLYDFCNYKTCLTKEVMIYAFISSLPDEVNNSISFSCNTKAFTL